MTAPLADYATLPLPLTPVEREQLADYEATITRGLNTFYEVGNAFVGIKQRKLYRAEHRTFEEYCREKWNITPQHAGRMIAAAEVVENLKSEPTGSLLPETERQARELKGLEPDQQRQVWQKAVDTAPGGKVTAQHIKDVRQAEIPMPEPAPKMMVTTNHPISVFVPPPAYESKICDHCKKRFPLGLLTMPDGRHLCVACQALVDDEPAACTACKEAHGSCTDCCYNCSQTCNAQQVCMLHDDEPEEREPEPIDADRDPMPGVNCPVCKTPTPLKYATYGNTSIYCPKCYREWPSVKVMQELWETPEQDDDDAEPDDPEPEQIEVEPETKMCLFCGERFAPDRTYCNDKNHYVVICPDCVQHAARDLDVEKAFHFMHQDRARMCAAGLVVLRVDLYKRIIYSYDPQKGGSWKLRLKCKNDGEMIDAVSRISDQPNTIFENRV